MQRSPLGHLQKEKSGPSQVPPAPGCREATDAIPTPAAQGRHRDAAKTQMLWKLVRSFDGDVPGFTQ